MAQRPKEHIRAEIVRAATSLFAEVGVSGTTIAAVAARAGVSTGNVYRYFEGKDQLFAEVLPDAFAAELRRRTQARVEALADTRDVRTLEKDAAYRVFSRELLEFTIENRERVVILLRHADGTPLASFRGELERLLVTWALAYARRAYPGFEVTPALRFALDRIYAAYVASLTAALAELDRPERIRAVVAHLSAHHLGGMKFLFENASTQGDGA